MPVTAIYLAGALSMLMIRLQGYRRWLARCRAYPEADEGTRRLVNKVCQRLKVRRVPAIRISDATPAPFVMGFLRPLLVLSRRQLVRPEELETVIVHEVTHFRRGDLLMRFFQCLAGILFFFWPVVAWVNRRIDTAREHACDEWALSHGKLTPGEYARCLLNAVRPLQRSLAWQPACMAGNARTIERRIDVILEANSRLRRRRIWGLLVAVSLVAWGGFVLTGPAQAQDKSDPNDAKYLPTEQSMRAHAKEVFARINEYAGGDLNDDGEVTKEECWAYVTAAVLQNSAAVLAKYPQADQNKDGELEFKEAFLFARGDDVIEGLHKKLDSKKKALSETKDEEAVKEFKAKVYAAEMEAWHFILDRRDQLLDMMSTRPTVAQVEAATQEMIKLGAKAEQDKLAGALARIAELEKEAQALLTKAAKADDATAAKLEAKAAKLAEEAAKLREGVAAKLKDKIAALEAKGEVAKAEELKAQLAELESE
jgi:hypothetical protein